MRTIECVTAAVLATFVALAGAAAAEAGKARFSEWATFSSERYGFQIAYPGNVFSETGGKSSAEGRVLVSRDGEARLIVGAFENEAEATLEEYRQQLLDENYPGADIDYAPRHRKGFIISGTHGNMHFYEKVSLTCGGRLINSWALLYPASERRYWDRVVEAIAPTYSPGAGRTGECD